MKRKGVFDANCHFNISNPMILLDTKGIEGMNVHGKSEWLGLHDK